MTTKINLPELGKPRVVIVGGGFAGLTLAQELSDKKYQVILIDRNNYHQFQPLFYQVAMAGLEPSSILFPFRKLFQNTERFFRMAEVKRISPKKKHIVTDQGIVNYDTLVLAMGANTHYFGNQEIKKNTLPMKTVSETILLRNKILEDYEKALTCTNKDLKQSYLNIVIVGGGPTGVELAGALAEMKKHILPKDYPELDVNEIKIYLVEGNSKLLKSMSESSSKNSLKYLEKLGVKVLLDTHVTSYNGEEVLLKKKDGEPSEIQSNKVIWAAGITGVPIPGIDKESLNPSGRYLVNAYCQILGETNIYAIGDIAQMVTKASPQGHPQVAQVALQQAKTLAKNLNNLESKNPLQEFSYKDFGSMATIGRHAAVADISRFHIKGIAAWYLWLLVHLNAILGVKNKIFVLINWLWNYISYDQSLRLIIKQKKD